jgi:hypothetical protein
MGFSGFLHAFVFGLAFVVMAGAAMAVWTILPLPSRRWTAPIVAGCAILVWIYAHFLFLDSLQMNGRAEPLTFANDIGAWEFVAIAAAIALLAGVAARWTREVAIGLLMLASAQSMLTAYNLVSNWRSGQGLIAADVDLAPLWRVSKSDNVFVFVLDTLQSDVAQEALSDGDLAAQFAGFTFYSNATAIAPTTYPSMPTIHSGIPWDPDTSLIQQYQRNVRRQSFLAQLGHAGYDTVQINPVHGVCPERTKLCLGTAYFAMSRPSRFVKEIIWLFDLSLLKTAPFLWKEEIYNRGFLFVSTLLSDASTAEHVINDLTFLESYRDKILIEGDGKTVKFIHLLSTHPPFILGDDCKMHDHVADESPVAAAKCSMREIAKILSKLKTEDAFENSLVIVAADHGGMRPIHYAENVDRVLASLMAAANPALIVRFPGSYGPLRENKASVSIADIAATVCEATASCTAGGGKPLQHVKPNSFDGRRRTYNHYSWRTEYWQLSKVPDVRTFEIMGDVRNPTSWLRIDQAPLIVGGVIDFRGTAPDRYLGLGWSDPEAWGRWTEGSAAHLRISMDRQPGRHCQGQ